METQLNLGEHQAIKNLTQAGIDEEQATVLVSTFGNFSNNIATKGDLEVVKQGLTQEMKAMDARQSQEMKAMDTKQSQEMKAMSQEMKAMDTKQSQRSDYLEKTLTQEMGAMEARQSQEMKAMETRQSQKSDYLEKTLVGEIAKSRYMMFAVMVAAAAIVLTLHEALERFLN